MGNCMTPTSPTWTMTTTGSLSTLFSNLTWRIKMDINCIWMRMTSYQVDVSSVWRESNSSWCARWWLVAYINRTLSSEPSAELLMNVSRSRRLIVLLSHAYLEQDWCCSNFRWGVPHRRNTDLHQWVHLLSVTCPRSLSVWRQGLLHLLELNQRPILIVLEGQTKRMRPETKQQLSEHQHCLTVLTWRHDSVVRMRSCQSGIEGQKDQI